MQKKKKIIVFRNDLSSYREFNVSYRAIAMAIGTVTVLISLFLYLLANLIFSTTYNFKIRKLKKTNDILWENVVEIKSELAKYSNMIDEIVQKDEQLRLALNLPAMSKDIRSVGVGGAEIASEFSNYSELFSKTDYNDFKSVIERVNKLENEIKFELSSYKNLVFTFKQKEDSVRYIPCVKPVPGHPITSRFGKRLHPILKVIKMHHGVDIMANIGTPIYAPADGIVKFVGTAGGYGKFLKIDHLKGFETRYGHLEKINVKIGQRVKRGDKIGEVGNTGISTGPHLHYEVLYHKTRLNPADFMIN